MRDFAEFVQMHEMPMIRYITGPFQTGEVDPTKGQFRLINQRDQKSVTHPKMRRQLEEALNRSTQYNWNIIVGDPQVTYGYGAAGKFKYIAALIEQGELQTEGHITFFKTESSGETLTAWMLLHNIGHALLDSNRLKAGKMAKTAIEAKLRRLESQPGLSDKDKGADLAKHFQFRSARMAVTDRDHRSAVAGSQELVFELVAEYLWHGHIRFNPSPQLPNLAEVVKEIEQLIHRILGIAVGQVLYD